MRRIPPESLDQLLGPGAISRGVPSEFADPLRRIALEPVEARALEGELSVDLDEHGRVAVVVLGGRHDLTDNVGRLDRGGCEYIRVATRSYEAIVCR